MEANLFLLLASGVMLAAGVYLMLDRAVTKIVLGLLLIGNAANLLIPRFIRTGKLIHWPKP